MSDPKDPVFHNYVPTQYSGWRTRVRDYTPLIGEENQALLDEVRDTVYQMTLDGGDLKTICQFFGWDHVIAKPQLQPIVEMARAELRLRLKQDQIQFALSSKQPLAKIWAGKQFGDQTDNPVDEDGGSGTATIELRVVRNTDPEMDAMRSELDALVANAERKAE